MGSGFRLSPERRSGWRQAKQSFAESRNDEKEVILIARTRRIIPFLAPASASYMAFSKSYLLLYNYVNL
jgi:hypothetical protein